MQTLTHPAFQLIEIRGIKRDGFAGIQPLKEVLLDNCLLLPGFQCFPRQDVTKHSMRVIPPICLKQQVKQTLTRLVELMGISHPPSMTNRMLAVNYYILMTYYCSAMTNHKHPYWTTRTQV